MSTRHNLEYPLRILVADDEAAIREAYGQVFGETDLRKDLNAIQDLRARLFKRDTPTNTTGGTMPRSIRSSTWCAYHFAPEPSAI